MTFARFGPLGALLGLVALAGVLYLLHRLRVRHREHQVVTTMFWHEAVEDVRARVLVRRFRQPLAYLLMCAIAAALWLGVAGPSLESGELRDHIVLLDASAGMARAGRLADAIDTTQELVRDLPRARTRVVVCGAQPATALLPGEDAVLLAARLHGLAPSHCPPTTSSVVRSLLAGPASTPLAVHVIGDLPESSSLPENVRVDVTPVRGGDAPNAGITALGATPARSGRRGRSDVFVETRSDSAEAPLAELSASAAQVIALQSESGTRRVLHIDVPTNSGTVVATLPGGDAVPADDTASLRLPSSAPIRVRADDALRPLIEPVLAASADLILVDGDADVVVTRNALESERPTLTVADAGSAHAILVTHRGERPSSAVLDEIVRALSLDAIDATGLARRAGRVVSVGVESGTARRLRVWPAFLGDDSALRSARTHPVFIAGALRWLAGRAQTPPFAASGERTPELRGVVEGRGGARFDALGAALTLPESGEYTRSDPERTADSVIVSLSSPFVTTPTVTGAADGAVPSAPGGGTGLVTFLGVLAFALLLFEWMAHRTGRMA